MNTALNLQAARPRMKSAAVTGNNELGRETVAEQKQLQPLFRVEVK